eukprot:1319920-Rhodomonas_salina.1
MGFSVIAIVITLAAIQVGPLMVQGSLAAWVYPGNGLRVQRLGIGFWVTPFPFCGIGGWVNG